MVILNFLGSVEDVLLDFLGIVFHDLTSEVNCIMQEKPHLFQFIPNEKQV